MASSRPSQMQGRRSYDDLARALDDLISAAGGEGDLDEEAHAILMRALEESVPTLEVHEVRVLHGKLEQAMLVFQRRRDEVAESLGEIKRSRRALSSYDHIKTFDKEQRLYRRA